MGSFPLTKSSYLILEAWNAAISFCGLQFFLRENIVFPFFCWVAQTARLYLTDMGSMCAPFLNSRGTSIPALELHAQAKISLTGEDWLFRVWAWVLCWDFSFVGHCVQSTHTSPWGGAACLIDFAQIILAMWSKSLNKEVSFWLIKKLVWPLDCLFPSWSHGAVEPLKHGLKENLTIPAEWEHLYYYLDKSLLLPNSNSYISLFIDI